MIGIEIRTTLFKLPGRRASSLIEDNEYLHPMHGRSIQYDLSNYLFISWHTKPRNILVRRRSSIISGLFKMATHLVIFAMLLTIKIQAAMSEHSTYL